MPESLTGLINVRQKQLQTNTNFSISYSVYQSRSKGKADRVSDPAPDHTYRNETLTTLYSSTIGSNVWPLRSKKAPFNSIWLAVHFTDNVPVFFCFFFSRCCFTLLISKQVLQLRLLM